MLKVGRYTAALVLVLVGGAVMADKLAGTSLIPKLVHWWPVLFIMLGFEYILSNRRHGQEERPLRLDLGGIIFAVVVAAVVIVTVQSPGVWKGLEGFRGLGSTSIAGVFEAFSDGQKFDKGVTKIPAADVKQIKIVNTNGNMKIQPGNVEQIEVSLSVYVNTDNAEEAADIADASRMDHQLEGDTLEIRTVPKEYGFKVMGRRKPRMDMTVTVPANLQADWDVRLVNGQIVASRLLLGERFVAEAVNGEISVQQLAGTVELKATNGQLKADKTEGDLSLKLTNGSLEVSEHRGAARLKATNAESVITGHSGDVEIDMTNGAIRVDGELGQLRTQSSSASVKIAASRIGGNWDVMTKHGKLDLLLPSDGSYTVEGVGGFGSVQSDLPLTVDKKSISGTVGGGTYRVLAETKGALAVQRLN
ncbi:DUF4097 family beta strand repeat-containing protein [Paenibacillus puerhi]|uniref:DUF4097 family beta strand repeat-containing protein n=1 Tax=Paenibacillus puerhi TaxID=2692622 RepID=UPI0013592F81|nr:DUF4097 family beta strand repeat-containing protein [Paenibacillus puerhi]